MYVYDSMCICLSLVPRPLKKCTFTNTHSTTQAQTRAHALRVPMIRRIPRRMPLTETIHEFHFKLTNLKICRYHVHACSFDLSMKFTKCMEQACCLGVRF